MEVLSRKNRKNKNRIHFHGIFSNVQNERLSPAINPKSGGVITKNGSIVYNLENYKLGFTTVSKVKNIEAVSHYISKYITKELLNLKNKKNVWHSRNLIKPNQTYHLSDETEIENFVSDNEITYQNEKIKDNYKKKFICIKEIQFENLKDGQLVNSN